MSNFIRDKPLRKTAVESTENDSDQEFIADSDENNSGSDSDLGSGKLKKRRIAFHSTLSESSDEIERMNKNEYKRSSRRVLRRKNEKKEDESENSSASSTEELSQKLQNLASSSSEEERQSQTKKRRKRNKMTISSSSSEDEKPPKKIQQRRTRRTTRQNRYSFFFEIYFLKTIKEFEKSLSQSRATKINRQLRIWPQVMKNLKSQRIRNLFRLRLHCGEISLRENIKPVLNLLFH